MLHAGLGFYFLCVGGLGLLGHEIGRSPRTGRRPWWVLLIAPLLLGGLAALAIVDAGSGGAWTRRLPFLGGIIPGALGLGIVVGRIRGPR